VNLGVQNEREWLRFCAVVLERPDLASDPRLDSNTKRVQNRALLHEAIHAAFAPLTANVVVQRLDRAGIANARLNTPLDFFAHPQLRERDRWRAVESPVGQLSALLPPIIMDGVEPRMDPIPDVSEHTDAILANLGYDQEQISALRAERVI